MSSPPQIKILRTPLLSYKFCIVDDRRHLWEGCLRGPAQLCEVRPQLSAQEDHQAAARGGAHDGISVSQVVHEFPVLFGCLQSHRQHTAGGGGGGGGGGGRGGVVKLEAVGRPERKKRELPLKNIAMPVDGPVNEAPVQGSLSQPVKRDRPSLQLSEMHRAPLLPRQIKGGVQEKGKLGN